MRVLREGYLYPYLPPCGVASTQVLQQISTDDYAAREESEKMAGSSGGDCWQCRVGWGDGDGAGAYVQG